MARVASPRTRGLLIVAVLMPLWSSYLVKVYAWRVILQEEGILNWALSPLGLSGPGFGNVATWLVFSYLWLPFMILPVYAGLERIPNSLLEASADLGAGGLRTLRRVILPLAFPAFVAGSIFTFSLTLGDYITPKLVSSTQFIGNVIYDTSAVANNLPLAAAFATVPVVIMILYLTVAKRLGAFETPVVVETRLARFGLRIGERLHARVPLPAALRDRALRLQREADPDLADPGPHARLVRQGVPKPRRARGAPRPR